MNVTEFAEQIVFGTTLKEKLAAPGDLDFSDVKETSTVVQSISTAAGHFEPDFCEHSGLRRCC